MNDEAVAVRRAAVDALGHRGDAAAAPLLIQCLESDIQPGTVRARAAAALAALRDPNKATDPLIRALNQEADPVRVRAAEALGDLRAATAVRALERAAKRDGEVTVRTAAIGALARLGGDGVAALTRLLHDATGAQRMQLIRAIGRSDAQEESIHCLAAYAAGADAAERLAAVEALATLTSPLAIEPLRAALAACADDPWARKWKTSELIMGALARYDDRRAIEAILEEFEGFGHVHAAAREALAKVAARRPDVSWLSIS